MKKIKSINEAISRTIRFFSVTRNFIFLLGFVLGAIMWGMVAAMAIAAKGEPGLLWGSTILLFQAFVLALTLLLLTLVAAFANRSVRYGEAHEQVETEVDSAEAFQERIEEEVSLEEAKKPKQKVKPESKIQDIV